MKIFISHKKEDETVANSIATELNKLGVSYYLDLLDTQISCSGKALTDHIKSNLNDCTDIIVVMSENTRYSQWVPFEVGMSAQKDMPTATYLKENVGLPDFLTYWPRLKKPSDIQKYVQTRNEVDIEYACKSLFESSSYARGKSKTERFYEVLKQKL